MPKVKSFNLKRNDRISSYIVIENIGRGWEGEVYKVKEVPTESKRALKLFRHDELKSVRHLSHFAWFYEQLQGTGHIPIYHHCGQWFLGDDNGCWYLVFEYINGLPLTEVEKTEPLFFKLAEAMSAIHNKGFAVGDIANLSNVFIRKSTEAIVFIDCDPGSPDRPNKNYRNDCHVELQMAAKKMFGSSIPESVKDFLKQLKGVARVNSTTLSNALAGRAG